MLGGNGADRLYGGGGNDSLEGGNGWDRLWGGQGDDIVSGGAGRDKLYGGNGDDSLYGGAGKDELRGGQGADLFIFNLGDGASSLNGADIVKDFKDGEDMISLTGGLTFENIAFYDDGKDAVVSTDGEIVAVFEKAAGDIGFSDSIFL